MFQAEEKDLGVGSMGFGVLEAKGDSEGIKDVIWRFGGFELGRGLAGVCGLCEPELLWGSHFPPQRGWGCVGEQQQQLGLGVGSRCRGCPAAPGDALKRPVLTLRAFSLVLGNNNGNWDL